MMSRRDFVKLSGVLGLSLMVVGCGVLADDDGVEESDAAFDGSVIVVGAGAAGMSAGHLLAQRGIGFRILEAAPTHGGRIKTTRDFVDFPIPLGAEWIHTTADILQRIVNDDEIPVTTKVVPYAPADRVAEYDDGELVFRRLGEYGDLKFVDATWLTFFERFVLPGIADQITFDTPVVDIDYSDDGVAVTDAAGTTHTAEAVIVTVPLTVLRDGDITFTPALPDRKRKALDQAYVWGGLKAFLEFREQFYPPLLEIAGTNNERGQKLWYDAAYGQDSDRHVLGLFTVGDQSTPYQGLTDDELRDLMLAELDEIFDGAATRTYVQHIAQDWSREPFIRQAYLADDANWRHPPVLREPLAGRVYFAGDAYTDGEDWGSVHLAAQSAREAVDALLG